MSAISELLETVVECPACEDGNEYREVAVFVGDVATPDYEISGPCAVCGGRARISIGDLAASSDARTAAIENDCAGALDAVLDALAVAKNRIRE